MRHLDVVHGILFALRPREIDVERELRIPLSHEEEVADRVAAHPLDQVAHGDVAAGALGDLHLLAAHHHRHHLVEHVLRVPLGDADAERLESSPHARDGAVVIGSLDIDRASEAALPLRDVVRDVRYEVGVRAPLRGTLAHDAILVVAVVGGTQEEGAVLLVRPAARDQCSDGAVDAPVGVERALEVVRVELHAERLEIGVLLLAEHLHGELARGGSGARHREDVADDERLLRRKLLRQRCVLLEEILGDVLDVLAVITALRNLQWLATHLAHAREGAPRQILDLHARVVVVELARDFPTGPLEQRRDRVAQCGLAAVPDVQRTGGVRADELHDDGPARATRRAAVAFPGCDERGDPLRDARRIETEIDEARSRDLRRRDPRRLPVDRRDDLLREVARLPAERLGEHHREVGGPVPERRITRTLEHRLRPRGRAKALRGARQLGAQRVQAVAHSLLLGLGAGFDSAGLASLFADSPAALSDDGAAPSPPADDDSAVFPSPFESEGAFFLWASLP